MSSVPACRYLLFNEVKTFRAGSQKLTVETSGENYRNPSQETVEVCTEPAAQKG